MRLYERLEVAGRVLRILGWVALGVTVIGALAAVVVALSPIDSPKVLLYSTLKSATACVSCFVMAILAFAVARTGKDVQEIKEKLSRQKDPGA